MMEPGSYDLLQRHWIPVTWLLYATEPKPPKVGISYALERASEIRCISHTAPFIEFGLYRLLVTIVLDAHIVAGQRPTVGKVRQMLANGNIEGSAIAEYLDSHRSAFDLWGEARPFLQRRLSSQKKGKDIKAEAVATIFPAIPSGNNVTLWNHFNERETAVSEEVAAQFLTTVSPWNFKTKPGDARTLAGDPPLYALVLGGNLLETILLNLPRPNGRSTAKQELDNGPIWRTPLDDLANLPKSPTITQGFTWPVRLIEMQKSEGPISKAVNLAAYKKPTEKASAKGASLYDSKGGWRDPNAGTETGSESIEHIKARPGIPIWRDAVPMLLVASEGETLAGQRRRSRPEVVTNALRLTEGSDLTVAVYGMRKKLGGGDVKLDEWFRSVLSFPAEVARDSRLSLRAIGAFKVAQEAANALQISLRLLNPPLKGDKKKRLLSTSQDQDLVADFWQSLEPLLAYSYLYGLACQDPAAEADLRKAIRREADGAFRKAAMPHRRDADGLRRVANAGNFLKLRLARLMPVEKNP